MQFYKVVFQQGQAKHPKKSLSIRGLDIGNILAAVHIQKVQNVLIKNSLQASLCKRNHHEEHSIKYLHEGRGHKQMFQRNSIDILNKMKI